MLARSGPDRECAAAGVEHDKVVAEAVHLQKRHLPHSVAYMAALAALSNAARAGQSSAGVTPSWRLISPLRAGHSTWQVAQFRP